MLLVLQISCATSPRRSSVTYDVKIINARVVDDTGAPWFEGDVGVRGDTIAAIGNLREATAEQVIDAGGRMLSPGFIDLLGWSYGPVLEDPRLESKIRQGVTTEIGGEGHSPGPISAEMRARIDAANPAAPKYLTLGDYMQLIERRGSAINFAFLVGASNARSMVIGSADRDPSEEEMSRMRGIIDQAMREGAIGLSTSLIYVPAIFSETDEIVQLARVAARYDGVYFTHIRNEGDKIDEALDEAFTIGRQADIPVNIWHLKVSNPLNFGRMQEVVAAIEAARESGLDVAANVYPYTASATGLSTRVPDWALEGGYQGLLERLRDPVQREKIASHLQMMFDTRGGPSAVLVTRIGNPEFAQFQRKRIDEIARTMNLSPVEATIALLESSDISPGAIFFSMNERDLQIALAKPWVSVGSDAGAVVGNAVQQGVHPRAYGTFPRILGRYARDERLFTIEEAVRRMTSLAASRVKFHDRGIIRRGMKADLVIFDPDTIIDRSVYENPHQLSEGVSDVIVNGVVVLRNGKMTGALPGRILRGRGYRRASVR